MNEKILVAFFIVISLISCATTNVPYNGSGTGEVRDGISRLQGQQGESVAASEKITANLDRIAEGIDDIVRELEDGTPRDGGFDSICGDVRKRAVGGKGDGGKD